MADSPTQQPKAKTTRRRRPFAKVLPWVPVAALAAVWTWLILEKAQDGRSDWIWEALFYGSLPVLWSLTLLRESRPDRKRFTRSFKIALLVVVVAAIVGAVGTFRSDHVRWKEHEHHRQVEDALRNAGGTYIERDNLAWMHGPEVNDASLKTLKALPTVRSVWIDNCRMTAEGLKPLADLPELETLDLQEVTGLTDDALAAVARLPHLRTLKLRDLPEVTEPGLAKLPPLTKLTSLEFHLPYDSNRKVTGVGGGHIAALRGQETLRLPLVKVTDEAMIGLASLPDLRQLELGGYGLTPAGLARLRTLPKLESLKLHARITHETLAVLASLPTLRTLDLDWVDSAAFAALPALTGVRELRVTANGCTDENLAALAGNASIRALTLDGDAVTDAGLAHLADLKNLEELAISSPRITNTGIAFLAGLDKLRTLRLHGANLTDAGFAHLAGLDQLRNLDLPIADLTDASLPVLVKLPRLETLTLPLDRLSPSTVLSLMKAHPGIKHSFPPKKPH